jgi:hypothetical protein
VADVLAEAGAAMRFGEVEVRWVDVLAVLCAVFLVVWFVWPWFA